MHVVSLLPICKAPYLDRKTFVWGGGEGEFLGMEKSSEVKVRKRLTI